MNDVSVAAIDWSVSVFCRFGICDLLVVSVMNDVSVAARSGQYGSEIRQSWLTCRVCGFRGLCSGSSY